MDSTTLFEKSATGTLAADAVAAQQARHLSWADAQLVAWALLAATSFVRNALRPASGIMGAREQVLQAIYPAGQLLAAGVVVAAATHAFRARGTRSLVWTLVATLGAGFTLAWTVLKDDFASLVNRLAYLAPPLVWRALIALACASTIPCALLAGRFLARRARIAGVLCALVAFLVIRNYFYPTIFPGMHLLTAIACAALAGGSLGDASIPVPIRRIFTRSPAVRRLPWVLATLWGACTIIVPPPPPVLFSMLQPPATTLAPFVAQLHAPVVPPARTPEEAAAAMSPEPAVPPSEKALLPADGAVVLLTIDCFRADLASDDRHEAALPNITAFRKSAAHFTEARAAGNVTIVSLSSIFTGRYESQLAWTERQTAHTRYKVPASDPSPRLPEVLASAGIPSTTFVGAEGFDSGSGIFRGFTEEKWLAPERGVALGEDLVSAAIERIESHESGPLFLYLHLFDAHDPYDRAGTEGTEMERYLRELTLVDRETGRLLAAIDARFHGNAAIIISADHGEAFGEHRSARHGNTVYDEVVHVPLLVRGPGIAPRSIAASISTIDLGPTILDLFHVATPSTFMGRSLVPLLTGNVSTSTRPVAIESLGYAAFVEDGWKVVRRKRFDTVELYDLTTDPEEKDNLYRETDPGAVARMRAMDTFFEAASAR